MFGNKSLRSRDRVYLLACAIEFCWLAIIALVPLVFLTIPDSPLELPKSVEFPKIVLFRSLVFLMVVLWFVKYLSTSHSMTLADRIGEILSLIKSKNMLQRTGQYFRNDPFRLIVLLAVLYFLSVTLSTIFSHHLRLSLWGYVPSSDNYSFYNLIHYGMLFVVIVFNLRDRNQMLRLLMMVIVVGVLISGYGVLEYYELGFLRAGLEKWDLNRVTSTLGNPVFLGSFLVFTIWVSMMVGLYGSISCKSIKAHCKHIVIWALVLGIQITALIATASRGPILATLLSFSVFAVLVGFAFGLKKASKSFLIPSLALFIAIGLISGANSIRSGPDPTDPNNTLLNRTYTDFYSDDVVSSSLLQRISIIKSSMEVIFDRPNITHGSTTVRLLDHIFGYGPESFQIAFMHRTDVLTDSNIPISTNHPHNFLVHLWVETGLLGFAAMFCLIFTIIIVCFYWLVRFRNSLTEFQLIFLIGIVALLLARIFEQLLGVAVVTDLMLFWIMVAIVCNFMILTGEPTKTLYPDSKHPSEPVAIRQTNLCQPLFCVLVFMGMIIFGLILWYKTMIPVIAFAQSSNINDDFANGEFASVLDSLQNSIKTAPSQYLYYSNLAYLYEAAPNSQITSATRFNCSDDELNELDADACFKTLAYRTYVSSIDAGDMRWETRYKAALTATELAVLIQSQSIALEALRLYDESIFMMPNSYIIRLSLGKALIDFGNPEKAEQVIKESLNMVGDSLAAIELKFWLGITYSKMGNMSSAYEIWNELISIDLDLIEAYSDLAYYIEAYLNLALMYESNSEIDIALAYYSKVIDLLEADLDWVSYKVDPDWVSPMGVSYYYSASGLLEQSLIEAYLQRASIYLQEGSLSLRDVDVDRLLELGVEPGRISHLR